MLVMRSFKVREFERGFYFRDREFKGVLRPGRHWITDPLMKARVDIVGVRDPWIRHHELDVIVKSGALGNEAEVVDLKDSERALVWIDGRFSALLGPGTHALWKVFRRVELDVHDAQTVRFEHEKLPVVLRSSGVAEWLNSHTVEAGHVGLYFRDGVYQSTLEPGTHAFWSGLGKVTIQSVDQREKVLDVVGQEIMTADKVTLRMNAVATYRVVDPIRAVTAVEDYRQALYREAQLALRQVVGSVDLDGLLGGKEVIAAELEASVRTRAETYGITVESLGIRDVILPGEMKTLMNRVTEARKAAEASLITRREETAAMRSQANTAKILEQNPTLMRLRELEVLEKVAEKSNLNVVLGEKGLVDRVAKLL